MKIGTYYDKSLIKMYLKVKNKKIDIRKIKAIIFDMDGTLVESEHIWAYAKQKIAEERKAARLKMVEDKKLAAEEKKAAAEAKAAAEKKRQDMFFGGAKDDDDLDNLPEIGSNFPSKNEDKFNMVMSSSKEGGGLLASIGLKKEELNKDESLYES